MDDKEQKFKTYRSLSDMHRFRLRLFAEGILTGIFAGIVISFFRFALSEMEYLRGALYNRLWVSDWSINACWFAVLIAIAFILHKLNCIEPMAAGSGIPQVKGAILGLMKMRWLHILWVKLTAGIIGIGAGLSLGREGPSIQLGAVAAQGVSRLMGRTRMEERYLLTSGASAGLAAAFNAPLAGVIFALEEWFCCHPWPQPSLRRLFPELFSVVRQFLISPTYSCFPSAITASSFWLLLPAVWQVSFLTGDC